MCAPDKLLNDVTGIITPMQAHINDWPTALTEIFKSLFYALTIIVPVLITGIVSWKISRQQLTLKSAELDAQATLKAREYVYELARRRLDRHHESSAGTNKALGELLNVAVNLKNEEQLRAFKKGLKGVRDSIMLFTAAGSMADILKAQGLYNEATKEEIKHIGEILSLDPEEVTADNAYEACMMYIDAMDKLDSMKALVLESLCRNVFSDYLPNSFLSDYLPRSKAHESSDGDPAKSRDKR